MEATFLCCARHAWQRLGNMNPEVAMELCISLLSENVPEWFAEKLSATKVSNKCSFAKYKDTSTFIV